MVKKINYGELQEKLTELFSKGKKYGRTLMFHEVGVAREGYAEYTISTSNFEKLIVGILHNDGKCDEVATIRNGNERSYYLTFDDGYESVYTNAFPILKKYNIPFCVFLSTSLLDLDGYMSYVQVEEMIKSGLCTVGGHTVSHKMLRYENKGDVKREIYENLLELQNKLKVEIEYFAYPYGSIYAVSLDNVLAVKRAKIKYAFSTLQCDIGFWGIKTKYFIPRWNVNDRLWMRYI